MDTGIAVTGKLTIAPTGSAFASVADGANLSIPQLTLGSVGAFKGTWGSTGSAAVNTSDIYFDALTSGILTVALDTTPTAKDIVTFGPGAQIGDTTIHWFVPSGADVTRLAPTYTVSLTATQDLTYPSGTTRNFSTPKTYTIKDQFGGTKIYTVTVTVDGLITPIAATAQSYYAPDDRAPVHAIDGSGMTPKSPVTTSSTCGTDPAGNMWLSAATMATWITFDLGSVQTITGFHLWNYNEAGNNFPGRGVWTAGIYAGTSMLTNGAPYASAGAAWGTLVEDMTFTMASGTAGYAGEDYFFATPVTTRYIQIYVTANFGIPDAYTGISEIRFFPSPATILNFGANAAGSSAVIGLPVGGAAAIAWTLPYDPYGKTGGAALIAALAPTYTLSSGTCPQPNDGSNLPTPAFPGPVSYTVTDTGVATNVYTVTVTIAPPLTACDITAFNANLAGSSAIITTGATNGTVVVKVPLGTTEAQVAALAPSYTLSALATCPQPNPGIPTPHLSTTNAVHYIVTAKDGVTTKDYTVTVTVLSQGWNYSAWTGDTDSGITAASEYTVAVNCNGAAVSVNGVAFQADALSGANFLIEGAVSRFPGGNNNVTGNSKTLASTFIYDGNPRTVTLYNLTPGATYETSLFAYGFDAAPFVRSATFASGSDSLVLDQNFYGEGNGIRIAYGFVADPSGSKVLTITPGSADTFCLSALANRKVSSAPPATILSFGTNVIGSSAVFGLPVGGAAAIAWTVPYGTVLATLAPTFTLSSGACNQTSGSVPSPNFGAGPVTYTVTDTGTTNVYTVTVTIAPPTTACDITAFNANFTESSASITTGATAGTVVVHVPFGTTEAQVAALAPSYTLSALATCDQTNSTIPIPALSTTTPVHYIVTANDGVTTKDYTVTVAIDGLITPITATAQSYYAGDDRAPLHAIDGSGMTPNSPVTTSSTCGTAPGGNMWLSDGNTDTWITFDLGSVQTIAGFHLWNYNEEPASPGRGVQTAGIYAGTNLLADGTAYASAGAAWGTLVEDMTFTMAPGTAGYAGEDYFLATPVTTRYLQIWVTSNFGTSDAYTGISEIRFFPAATILSFGANVARSSAVISGPSTGGKATIAWTVLYGTPVTNLQPSYTLSSGTCDKDNAGPTGYDFSSPVTYTVTAPGVATNVYTVTVTVAPASTAKVMSNVFFPGLGYAIPVDSTGTNLVLYVASGTSVTGLAPTYDVSEFASGSPVSGTTRNFTTPQTYTVTAQNNSQQAYSVAVEPFAAGQGYSALVLAAGPVAYWPLGEFTGTTAADITGNGHDAEYSGAFTLGVPGLVPLNSGAAVDFTGGADPNGATATAPYSDSLNPATFTVEGWIKPNDLNVAYDVAMQDRSTGPRLGYAIQMNNGTPGWRFTFGTSLTTDNSILSGTSVEAGSVYYVVATYDGTAANLYVNGALANSLATTYQPATPSAVDFTIGSRNGNTAANAIMQNVAFYNRALTPAEILTHFNGGNVAPPVLGFVPNGNGTFTLTWTSGRLLEATNVMGPWTTNTAPGPTLIVTPDKAVPQRYYRVQAP